MQTFFRLSFFISVLSVLGIQAASAQTAHDLLVCQRKTPADVQTILRACSVFIDTRRTVDRRPLPTIALAGALGLRGNAYMLTRDYDRSIADFTEAIRLTPSSRKASATELFYNRGMVYLLKRDFDAARADLDRAKQIDPNSQLAARGLDAAKLAQRLDEKWLGYLKTIEADGDYSNWSGPPSKVFTAAR